MFVEHYRARWADMDFNQHMRNASFLGVAEETRMRYLESGGWTMAEFQKRKLGPVVLEDRLIYKRELRLLEPFHVDIQLLASTENLRRIKLRNRFFRDSDDALAASVESVIVWFDLAARQPVVPPPELQTLWQKLDRADDFESW